MSVWVACLMTLRPAVFMMLTVLAGAVRPGRAGPTDSDPYTYTAVADAGSSGTKVHIYRWRSDSTSSDPLPYIDGIFDKKIKPGFSAYVGDIPGLLRHVAEVVELTKENIPQDKHQSSHFYCLATAGMRLIDGRKAKILMDAVDNYLSLPDVNPFIYSSALSRILSGEEEGAFMWIAVNYLRGYFRLENPPESAGVIESGGASLQIAFHPSLPLLANKFPVKVLGVYHPLYSHSYLTYGQNYVRLWAMEELIRRHPHDSLIEHPCILKGDSRTLTRSDDVIITFNGTSDYGQCERLLSALVYNVSGWRCQPKPCSIGSVYQPSISRHKEFFLLGSFRYTLRAVGTMEEDGTFVPEITMEATRSYCSQDFRTARQKTAAPDQYLSDYCLMGTFVPMVLTDGYGFNSSTRQVKAVEKVGNRTADWSLGAVIYEMERANSWVSCPKIRASSRGRCERPVGALLLCLVLGTLVLIQAASCPCETGGDRPRLLRGRFWLGRSSITEPHLALRPPVQIGQAVS